MGRRQKRYIILTRYRSTVSEGFKRARRDLHLQVVRAVENWTKMVNEKWVLPVTPMDTGQLRESLYTIRDMTYNGVRVEVGFTASYAPEVHEWPKKKINWTTAGTGPKFLQSPYYTNALSLRAYIVNNVRLR